MVHGLFVCYIIGCLTQRLYPYSESMNRRMTGSIQQEINGESEFHESEFFSHRESIQRLDEYIKETEVNQI